MLSQQALEPERRQDYGEPYQVRQVPGAIDRTPQVSDGGQQYQQGKDEDDKGNFRRTQF